MSQNFENPYESFGHQAGPGGSRQADLNIQSKVKGPAIALMAAAVLWVIYSGYAIVMNLIGAAIVQQQQMRGGLSADQQQYINILIGCVGIVLGGAIFLGAYKMMQLQSYRAAMTATIVAMLPCSPCCILSLPLGIWSLVVLLNSEVKAAFS